MFAENASKTTQEAVFPLAHSGTQCAGVIPEPAGSQQRELLLTPEIRVADDRITLEFWVRVLDRNRFENDNDVELWVATGAWDVGGVDDERLDPDDIALKPSSSDWMKRSYDLAAYQGEEICIAWRFSTVSGGDFLMDDVIIAPHKVEMGRSMDCVPVISNTSGGVGTPALVRDVLPAGVGHVAGTASVALESGVVSRAFTDTASTIECLFPMMRKREIATASRSESGRARIRPRYGVES